MGKDFCAGESSGPAKSPSLIAVSPLHDALVVVDMQNDFVSPCGALSVPGAMEVIPVINHVCQAHKFRTIAVAKDWHPPDHSSFCKPAGPGGQWPPHCVQGTDGAELHSSLRLGRMDCVIHKGADRDAECYSCFGDVNGKKTGLATLLREMDVRRVFICGVAFDFCVYYTALDAVKEMFDVVVLEDATRAVFPDNISKQRGDLLRNGVKLADSKDLTTSPSASL
ncbi:putative nicotinamidase [Trypanosoma cruzi]|nr:putative nicotinamidase [Trypanosoma cruzi]